MRRPAVSVFLRMHKPTGILIAAGKSRRFGADKLLHPLADGIPLAVAAYRNLLPACAEVVVILRPEQEVLASKLWNEGARIVISERCHDGMGYSLAAGVHESPNAQGWMLTLADMPYVQPQSILNVAQALSAGASIVAPAYQGKRGHPVGFAPAWFAQLCGLNGDSGARSLIDANLPELQLLECNDPGVCRDVDTPADLLNA